MAQPTLSLFTGDETFGTIFSEQNQIIAKFVDTTVPFSSTTSKINLGVLGNARIIVLQGATDGTGWTGATVDARIKDFIDTMETWINISGGQTSKTYTDSFGDTYTVYAFDFTWQRTNSDPGRISYSLLMKEGI